MDIGPIDPARFSFSTSLTVASASQSHNEPQALIRAVEAVNHSGIMGQSQELVFTFEKDGRKPILQIVDKETGEVVRQVPPEYALRLAQQAKQR